MHAVVVQQNGLSILATSFPFWLFTSSIGLCLSSSWSLYANSTRNMGAQKKKPSDKKDAKKTFIIAMFLSVMLGLGWGFGLLATSSEIEELTFTFQVIFSIFVGSQGLLIFIFYGVRNTDFMEFWKKLLMVHKCCPKSKYTVSNSQKPFIAVRNPGSGSGSDSAAFSSRSSEPEKIDLSKENNMSDEFIRLHQTSHVQSPADSVFMHVKVKCAQNLVLNPWMVFEFQESRELSL